MLGYGADAERPVKLPSLTVVPASLLIHQVRYVILDRAFTRGRDQMSPDVVDLTQVSAQAPHFARHFRISVKVPAMLAIWHVALEKHASA